MHLVSKLASTFNKRTLCTSCGVSVYFVALRDLNLFKSEAQAGRRRHCERSSQQNRLTISRLLLYWHTFFMYVIYIFRCPIGNHMLFFPILQLWQLLLQKCTSFFRASPIHIGNNVLDDCLHSAVFMSSINIAPFAILIVHRSIGFPAQIVVIQRHSANLTGGVARLPQKRIDGYAETPRYNFERYLCSEQFRRSPNGIPPAG